QPRLDLLDGEPGDRAGEARREGDALVRFVLVAEDVAGLVIIRLARTAVALLVLGRFLAGRTERSVGELDDGNAVREVELRLEAVREPRRDIRADDDAVHDNVDVVLVLLVELRRVRDFVEGAVDLDALEALLLQLRQLLAVFALAATHDGREQVKPRTLGQRQHAIDHLADRLALDGQPRDRRVGDAHTREQQAQVVVDLRNRADGGPWVLG